MLQCENSSKKCLHKIKCLYFISADNCNINKLPHCSYWTPITRNIGWTTNVVLSYVKLLIWNHISIVVQKLMLQSLNIILLNGSYYIWYSLARYHFNFKLIELWGTCLGNVMKFPNFCWESLEHQLNTISNGCHTIMKWTDPVLLILI